MTEDVGVRLGNLANERRLVDEARSEELRRARELDQAKSEANLEYLRGMLARMVSGFNRTADPKLHVSLKVEECRIYLLQTYTTLMILSFEPDCVVLGSPPRAPQIIHKRFRFEPMQGGATALVEDARPDARPGSPESFCEGVLMMALGLYAFD